MLARRVVARALIPAAVIIVEKGKDLKCRPSELPIYTSDAPIERMKIERPPPTYVEEQIGNVRRQIFSMANEVTALEDKAVELYENAYGQVEWLINYLGEEDNTTPKYGAIAVGGLAGFILALRGGKFRKLVFTSAGALGMAAICYPREAAEYSQLFKEEAVRYAKIGYNFYHGVVGGGEKTSKEDDAEVQLLGLALDDSKINVDSENLVAKLHEKSMHEDCHCPVGTCLNPQEEAPPAPSK